MPIYRHDQARLSVSSEPALGGYLDFVPTATVTGWTAQLSGRAPSGARSIAFDTGAGGTLAVGDYIQIGNVSALHSEIRRISSLGTYNGTGATGTVFLDYPLGFSHPDSTNEQNVSRLNAASLGLTGNSLITFLPGVYESITTPDLTPELLPQYFLKTTGDRNWGYMYRGRQAFSGSLPNLILLNGIPLRFPIGSVRTVAAAVSGGTTTLVGTHFKGERFVTLALASTFANGELIEIERGGTNPEVREIISGGGTTTLVLNYPLMFEHAGGVNINEATAGTTFTHTLIETARLDSLTWNVRMRDTGEVAANDFTRRFVGGVVNRATLTANEGELLRLSWDEVQFIDLVHNQTTMTGISGTDPVAKSSAALIDPSTSPGGIGSAIPQSGGTFGVPTYPTTEPYYFSQGNVSIFGITFARIRNFRLDINNNTEPRYYIRDLGTERTPIDIQEQRREYTLTATIAMEDSVAASATTRTLWKELILEGAYTGTGTPALQGFDMTLTFTRGTNDIITITSPILTATTAFERQGCFFRRAQNSIETESPVQVEGEIIMRNMQVTVTDSIGVYP